MTKRIVSGIFILTALGALGVILAGALTSGEQLIVRFLTAVIVAALGLYVISDLRLQADDDAMTARSNGHPRMATVDAPPNSTAAFMATVTRRSEQKVDEVTADSVGPMDAAVAGRADQQVVGVGATTSSVAEQESAVVEDAESSSDPATPSQDPAARPKAPETIRASTISPPTDISLTDLFTPTKSLNGRRNGATPPPPTPAGVANGVAPTADGHDGNESTTVGANGASSGAANEVEPAAANQISAESTNATSGVPEPTSLSSIIDPVDSADPSRQPETAETADRDVPEVAEVAEQVADIPVPLEALSLSGTTSRSGVFDNTLVTASASNGSGPQRNGASRNGASHRDTHNGTNLSNGHATGGRNGANGHATGGWNGTGGPSAIGNDSTATDPTATESAATGSNGSVPSGDGPGSDQADGVPAETAQSQAAQSQETAPAGAAPAERKAEFSDQASKTGEIERPTANGPAQGDDADGQQNTSEFAYSDELQSPQHEWPTPPAKPVDQVPQPHPFEKASAAYQAEKERLAAVETGSSQLPVAAQKQELEAADYADAPLAPIIDLREANGHNSSSVDLAINAGEVEVIATLIEQGMLSTDGPISDRDVRTMVYVAFTSNELRKLLLAGGTPDGPNYGLDLGPVELFDERVHAPAPKTLYSGSPQQRPEQQQRQLG